METRRTVLITTAISPLLARLALAKGSYNAELLKLTVGLNNTTLSLDGDFTIVCTLESRLKFVRVYAPLNWGSERGFRLKIVAPNGKLTQADLHIPGPAIAKMFNDNSHFHELDVGESTSFRSELKARDVFGALGTFNLSALYTPEPMRAFTSVQDAIVFENGSVESGSVRIKVV
jgi:hypothetical protein